MYELTFWHHVNKINTPPVIDQNQFKTVIGIQEPTRPYNQYGE